jgi:acetyltransferase
MNLDKIFNPKSIAIIGASDQSLSVGFGLTKNIFLGKKHRKIFLINPNQKKIFGQKTFSSILDIKQSVDLAIIAVPAKIVPLVAKECTRFRVGGAIIISAGFSETGNIGKKLEEEIKEIFKKAYIPLIGPNCLGIMKPSIELNATFAPSTPKEGNIAFISQSGALIDSVISQSSQENYGFSLIISHGNEAGITLPDLLNVAAEDKNTKVITLYLEGLKDGRKFFETAKKITCVKPILVLKGGKSKKTQKTVSSHTGALAGNAELYSAMFKQAGIIEVESIEELFDTAKTLSWQPKCNNGIAIITNGGGAGILTADYCNKYNILLPSLSSQTKNLIENSKIMHPAWSKDNPIDIVGDALSNRYEIAINSALKQKNVNGLIIIQSLQIMTESLKNARVIIRANKKWPKKPIITVFMGGDKKIPELLEKNNIPNYSDPLRAVKSFKELIIRR